MNPRTATILSMLLLAAGLSGCLEMEQTITINADGSGTQAVRLGMSPAVLAEVKRAVSVTAPGGGVDPAQVFDKPAVDRELEGTGLSLTTHRTFEEGGRKWVELELAFEGVDALRKSPLSGSAPEWEFAPGPVPGTVRIALYPQGKQAWGKGRQQAEKLLAEDDAVANTWFEKRRQQLTGLDVALTIVVPGKVLRWTRNLDKAGDDRVVARVTADQIGSASDLVRRIAPRYEVIIEAKDCKLPLDPR